MIPGTEESSPRKILIVRLGAMGDVLHALPAVESLARTFPFASIDWVVKPQWIPLLEGNSHLREVIPYTRKSIGDIWAIARSLRERSYDLVVDLQGLIQSAMVARLCGAKSVAGYDAPLCREPLASRFYHRRLTSNSAHIAERHLDAVAALGATLTGLDCQLPDGVAEGTLPDGPYVLASPFAGWAGKQWPIEHYVELGESLARDGLATLVLNVNSKDRERLPSAAARCLHESGIPGLIHATRHAAAVVGVDSGPLHLAAALGQRGVAIFGPTDPARNGPVGNRFTVLRDASAVTTYKRHDHIGEAMRRVTPGAVYETLRTMLRTQTSPSPKEPEV